MQDLLRWPSRMKVKVSTDEAPSISRDRVAAFRLSRHHLASRAPASALVQVAGGMGGGQAPGLSPAQKSLWARTRGLRAKDVGKGPWHDRTLAQGLGMPGTLVLGPAKDFAGFRGGV